MSQEPYGFLIPAKNLPIRVTEPPIPRPIQAKNLANLARHSSQTHFPPLDRSSFYFPLLYSFTLSPEGRATPEFSDKCPKNHANIRTFSDIPRTPIHSLLSHCSTSLLFTPPGGVEHSGTFWDISDINLRTNGLAKGLTGRVGCPVPKLSPRRLTSRGRLGKNRGGQRL
jgi:hypothetical protein